MAIDHGIFSLKDKVIVVTGGTRRYGYYFCEGLARAGGTVIVSSRDRKRAETAAAKLASGEGKCFGYRLEQADDDSIEEFVAAVIGDHERIDVLVNNARRIPQMPAPDIDREELELLFTINAVGMILLTRKVVEEMKKTGGGNIINVGSIYGMGGQDLSIYENPGQNMSWDYPIQKGGAIAFTKQLATCLAQHNIRANCISLGGLRETASDDPVVRQHYCKRVPLGRMADGKDVWGPIVFLASDASAYMTGANLVVDGGWTAW